VVKKTNDELLLTSKIVVARNINDNVIAARVMWKQESRFLELTYYLNQEPTDTEEDHCELAVGELIGEFNEIISANCSCVYLRDDSKIDHMEGLVFRK